MTIREASAVGVEPVVLTSESTVVGLYEPQETDRTGYQSEAELEAAFIRQLQAQAYEYVSFTSEDELVANLRTQLEALNDYTFTDEEWERFFAQSIRTRSGGGDEIAEKTRRIQEDHVQTLIRDNGESKNIRLIDKQHIHNNRLQVTNQYVVETGAHHTRYDVTVLVNGLPLVHVSTPRITGASAFAKRSIDVVCSGLGLLLLFPLFAIVALVVKSDRGPVFFFQERVGIKGQPFKMVKFRSMRTDAEEIKKQLAAQNEGHGLLFKMANDPRVTPVGRFIRKYSIDELPQLWNVFKGDMSLVGPRPPLPEEVEKYEEMVYRRLLVKPGITGLWQVSGRSDLSWEESVRLDLYYVENWSLTTDFVILARTVRAVFAKDGAY